MTVQRQLEEVRVTSRFLQDVDGTWKVRVGPVGRSDMLAVLNGFVW
jgi:hypothetical protein